ncbi:MAG: oxidoreductase [Nocardia sp.]|uniref:aldo/keto reductase n=1 Tax=Nocardia sp. TaxID=1821 RepID=UPI0026018C65|nr:aldo/keto reductase [Nocardia sp.]MCU1644976.1 oxidoreductase [Nocardia sp.]
MTKTITVAGDLRVNRIGYGTMRLADAAVWHGPADRDAAITVLRGAIELGVNFVDTSDAYALGESEQLIAEALHPYGEDLVIATKVGVTRPSPAEWEPLGHPAYLRQQAELSLRRLKLDHIDLLQLHRIDPKVPLADQIGALRQLLDEGKVRHIGLSEATVEQIREAVEIAPIASVQNQYSLATRHEEPVLDYTAAQGITFIPYFPVAMVDTAAGSPVATVAAEIGATATQTALAWLLHRSPTVLPIPGTTSLSHLRENVAAADLQLSDEQFERLSASVAAPVAAP